jgi:hypothetical protein
MKSYNLALVLTVLFFSSCNFNLTDIPGPQISTTIRSSKKHGTFICSFRIKGNALNGVEIESIFAEKKYFLRKGFFGKSKINSSESQLVIVFKSDNKMITINDIPKNWDVVGFTLHNSKIIVNEYKGNIFKDSIQIKLIPNLKVPSSFEILTLYKIK